MELNYERFACRQSLGQSSPHNLINNNLISVSSTTSRRKLRHLRRRKTIWNRSRCECYYLTTTSEFRFDSHHGSLTIVVLVSRITLIFFHFQSKAAGRWNLLKIYATSSFYYEIMRPIYVRLYRMWVHSNGPRSDCVCQTFARTIDLTTVASVLDIYLLRLQYIPSCLTPSSWRMNE